MRLDEVAVRDVVLHFGAEVNDALRGDRATAALYAGGSWERRVLLRAHTIAILSDISATIVASATRNRPLSGSENIFVDGISSGVVATEIIFGSIS